MRPRRHPRKTSITHTAPHDPFGDATLTAGAGLTAAVIRKRAYEIFLSRAGDRPDPVSDWLQAESELRAVSNPQHAEARS